ncbi:hypothetical protein [Chromobacterium phragmitis]|uniref:hypothetical protein n=1 Tax=Chromobacterium phragmitis TaxID=2202141 RepID=UPI0032635C0B
MPDVETGWYDAAKSARGGFFPGENMFSRYARAAGIESEKQEKPAPAFAAHYPEAAGFRHNQADGDMGSG